MRAWLQEQKAKQRHKEYERGKRDAKNRDSRCTTCATRATTRPWRCPSAPPGRTSRPPTGVLPPSTAPHMCIDTLAAAAKCQMSPCWWGCLPMDPSHAALVLSCSRRRLAKLWHPDKHPENAEEAKQRFQKIQRAYDSLMLTEEDARIEALAQ